MPSGIPDLEADGGGRFGVEDAFREEGGADCAGGRWGREGILDVALDEGGFADALGAEDADFGFEGIRHYVLFFEGGECENCIRGLSFCAPLSGFKEREGCYAPGKAVSDEDDVSTI